uniref:Uncharacterized protein n=1 Tax=Glossina palpalis gambiensis TaxID=67801 RepID=A0A1B0BUE0_9MUSC
MKQLASGFKSFQSFAYSVNPKSMRPPMRFQLPYVTLTRLVMSANTKSVHVSLNAMYLRDKITEQCLKFRKTQALKASDFVTDPETHNNLVNCHAFLLAQYSPAAGKLNVICLQLSQSKFVGKANQRHHLISLLLSGRFLV